MKIVSTIDDLSTMRIAELESLLIEISNNRHLPRNKRIFSVHTQNAFKQIVFYASDSPKPLLNYTQTRFQTICEHFNASYSEVWKQIPGSNEAFLEKAYLHVYNTTDEYAATINENGEFIFLHCDPNIPKDEDHYRVKVGPHLHFEFAQHPLRRSHWALNLSNLDHVLHSRDNLNVAFQDAIFQIRTQLFELYDDYLLSELIK